MTAIVEPGVYDGMPAEQYHADPVPGGSLSSSGARLLLDCPARYRYAVDHPAPPKREYDLGHAAHRLVLGAGAGIVVVDADDWRTKAARTARDDAHAAGAVPLLTHEHEQVQAMAAALRAHPVASALFDPTRGRPEQSLFWRDSRTGVQCRARLDWLPDAPAAGGRLLVGDYKTCRSADPDGLPRVVHDYGYHQQGAWYTDAVRALGLADDVAYLLVCQEKDPPYLVTVAQLAEVALRIGRDRNRAALRLYRHCTETNQWPGYGDDVAYVSLPAWVENQYLEAIA